MDMFIEVLKAFFIGVVEGITEWLPISSTGHMILVDEFVKLNVSAEFLELFLVVIQLGAIMAVLILYFHKLNPFSPKKTSAEKRGTWRLWGMVAIGATVDARQPTWPVAPPGVPAAPMRVPCPRWVRATMATTPRWPCSACAPWTRSTGRRR